MNKKIIIGENLLILQILNWTKLEIQKESNNSNKKCYLIYGFYYLYLYLLYNII